MLNSQSYRRIFILTVLVAMSAGLLTLSTGLSRYPHPPTRNVSASARSTALLAAYGKLPLSFEANFGQTESNVKFRAQGTGYTLFLTASDPVLAFGNKTSQSTLHLHLTGTNTHPQVVGLDELPGKMNYFSGNDPQKWRTNVPTYARVLYANVYPGVNLVYSGNQGQLEYTFMLAPRANLQTIRLTFEGAENLRLDTQGNLLVHMVSGDIRQEKPVSYQEVNGVKRVIDSQYVLTGANQIGFAMGAYDVHLPLIIDPVLSYSTYLGGSGDDYGNAIAVDRAGNAYVTGSTNSGDFPLAHALQGGERGQEDAFVTKLNATGTALIYSTYLGGTGDDAGYSIAADSAGNAYVAGSTTSTDFPLAHALQGTKHGNTNAFVTKLNANGSALVYSTYLGGSCLDGALAIKVDSAGNAYVTGFTCSPDFPTQHALQGTYHGNQDAFVTKINAGGSALVYSTYLGGSGSDTGTSIALDSAGNAYVTGYTASTDFPLAHALQNTFGGGQYDAFVTKISTSGSTLVYSTYLGGSNEDRGSSIAVDSAGNAYVTGYTYSSNFPTVHALQGSISGSDAFVTKLNASGSALVYSTYLGGYSLDQGYGIAVDSAGNAYVIGTTYSTNFPTVHAIQKTLHAYQNAFVSELNANDSAFVYSTYLGGSGGEYGQGIAVDNAGNTYIIGTTASKDFPTVHPIQGKLGSVGYWDTFISKIAP